ncbi:DUF3054 domain-containing protein [Natrinema thermotolerans]|uniref:DUF3054 domain-containing protein n=1 Tax=Natrinema thermotolerans TaxID=121872 RepID=A0AAF0SZ10_9EURY|nr:DUF3054 domain-containing protein [Natrinema thermotolerans]ELZ07089.1 hypothetical protein C478_19399 [Natrinema thermotolerans DSM 11552]QCC60639.1 DUF3054 domain-containing protein [Natrinema thermotolerans]QCC61524.1 DUF3054 domain-containing protein [Natrinema thermotolerans]WMT07681.1 DUF3054 domain-containing protein [Natrinema thermotolerans]WMT08313.1 DUF3054 domain-containing protein [Natrinema thermotolerans]
MDTAVRTDTHDGAADRDRLVAGIVDVLCIVGIVLLGRISHSGNPIAEPIASLETVTPFVVGWLAVAALAGVYATERAGASREFRLPAVAWIAAANVGLMLRGSPLFDGGTTWPFPVVITATGLAVLLGWRLVYTLYLSATR